MPPIDKPIPRDTGTPNSRLDNFTPTEQWQYIWSDTNRYNLSSATLWGIFGVASNYGQSYKELADGAAGPFQIKLRIWDIYSHQLGYGTHDIQDFMKSADVACVALQSLGADGNPTSKKTIGALNLFHATGGGENVTPYVQSVWKKGNTAVSGGNKPAAGSTTGTTPNIVPNQFAAPFTIGDSSSPDTDIWTGVNSLSQSAQWYLFSDGEILYVADGYQLMAQAPAAYIDRWDSHDPSVANPKILHASMTYDNTAFQYVTTHKKRGKIQRKSALAKVTSPTELTIDWICKIDEIRAGDVVYLMHFGMADGPWLVGDCTRSIFAVYSSLTLVPAMMPIYAGTTSSTTGAAASAAGSGTVIANMISAASQINNQKLPYQYGGGHKAVGTPDTGVPGGNHEGTAPGYDCSGCVAAVLQAGGLWTAGSVGSDADIISTLKKNSIILSGQGTGDPECTLFDRSGYHIFMRLNGQYFGTGDGGGKPTHDGGGGGAWLESGSDVATFDKWHVPMNLLTQGGSGGATGSYGSTGGGGLSASKPSNGGPSQVDVAATLISVGKSLQANDIAIVACLCAGMGESNMGADNDTYVDNGHGYWGVLQGADGQHGTPLTWPDPHNIQGQATSFYQGGKGYQAGGAIYLVKSGETDPGTIATKVEASGEPGSYYGAHQAAMETVLSNWKGG